MKHRFKTVPLPVLDHIAQQRDQAVQGIAFLMIHTLEDAKKAMPPDFEGDAVGLLSWAQDMREDLEAGWKDDMLAMLAKQSFLTNTHCGFVIGPLETPGNSVRLTALYAEIEKLAETYGTKLPDDDELVATLLACRPLVYGIETTFTEEEVQFALDNEGKVLLLQAIIESLIGKGQ